MCGVKLEAVSHSSKLFKQTLQANSSSELFKQTLQANSSSKLFKPTLQANSSSKLFKQTLQANSSHSQANSSHISLRWNYNETTAYCLNGVKLLSQRWNQDMLIKQNTQILTTVFDSASGFSCDLTGSLTFPAPSAWAYWERSDWTFTKANISSIDCNLSSLLLS